MAELFPIKSPFPGSHMASVTAFPYGRHKYFCKEPIPIQANQMASGSSANATQACTVAFTAPSPSSSGNKYRIAIDRLDYDYRVAATSGGIVITDGTLSWGPFQIVDATKHSETFDPPLLFSVGSAVTVAMSNSGQTADLFAQAHVEGVDGV